MVTLCHLSRLVETQAAKFGEKTALAYRNAKSGKWTPVSWVEFSKTVHRTSKALLAMGVNEQEKVAIFSDNMPNCFYVDFGCYGIRAVTIPFYANSSTEQAHYMISDAEIHTVFVGGQQQYDTVFSLLPICPSFERIVIFDDTVVKHPTDNISLYFDDFLALGDDDSLDAVVDLRKGRAQDTDICNILYTSGTTGSSKGVVLTYGMYNAAIKGNSEVLDFSEKDICLNFLPFTHVFERGWAYLGLSTGAVQVINRNPADALKAMQQIRPTCMCAVPRFWEKIYEGILERVQSGGIVKRKLFETALATGRRVYEDYVTQGKPVPLALSVKYRFFDSMVFSLIRRTLGLDRGNFFPTAGATISHDIESFVHACGINMVAGYGLTESTATVSCDQRGRRFTIGSVGRVLREVEVKISAQGEILLKGPTIMSRYYRKPKSTAEAIDAEGWFHTGDGGYIKDGELFLTDRIKDLYKTSNGKYIAPQQIEAKLVVDKYIDQVVIIADRYKYVSALIVPCYEMLRQYAKLHNLKAVTNTELCADRTIVGMIADRIDTLQQGLAKYEQVKRFTLLPQPFSMERGEMTNTLKVKRRVVFDHYSDEIEKMYE